MNRSALKIPDRGYDSEEINAFLLGQAGVTATHDLDVWPMSTTGTALTVHLIIPGGYPGDAYKVRIADGLKRRFGIQHATIQVETGRLQ